MAKLKSFEEYIESNINTAEEIEKDMMATGEPKANGDGDEVQSQDQKIGAEKVEDETSGDDAGTRIEDMPMASTHGEEDMKIGGEVVDTNPQDMSDDIMGNMEDPEENATDSEVDSEEDEDSDDAGDSVEMEEGNAFSTARLKAIEAGEKEFKFDGKTYPLTKVDSEDKEAADDIVDEKESNDEVNTKTADITSNEMLHEAYKAIKKEAMVYEEDMHDDHTVESYLKENAALVAALAAKTLTELREDIKLEAYESTCNELKEAYAKKIDEMKESYSAGGEEIEDDDVE
jgi:hypothetical protein